MKIFIPSLFLILLAIFIGSLGCGFYGCYATLTLLAVVAFAIGMSLARVLIKEWTIKGWLVGILLIVFYILGSYLIAIVAMEYFNYRMHEPGAIEKSLEKRKQKFESVKIGDIKKVENLLVYECKICGYRFNFPSDWGFEEEKEFRGSDVGREWVIYRFHVTTPNYKLTYAYGQKWKGQSFEIISNPYNALPLVGSQTEEAADIKVGDVKGKITKSYFGRTNEFALSFLGITRQFDILGNFVDEKELDQNLGILLRNFEFLD